MKNGKKIIKQKIMMKKKSSNKIKQRLEKSEMVEDIINEARNIKNAEIYRKKGKWRKSF